MWSVISVGRIPTITIDDPVRAAFSSAAFRLSRMFDSIVSSPMPSIWPGGTLISMLNWPSSVWNASSSIALSTSVFLNAGSCLLVDQVQLDLDPGHRPLGSEPGLAQHPSERVQVAMDLVAERGPVRPGELDPVDFLTHDGLPCWLLASVCPKVPTDVRRNRVVPQTGWTMKSSRTIRAGSGPASSSTAASSVSTPGASCSTCSAGCLSAPIS